jgi:hypothetical protein
MGQMVRGHSQLWAYSADDEGSNIIGEDALCCATLNSTHSCHSKVIFRRRRWSIFDWRNVEEFKSVCLTQTITPHHSKKINRDFEPEAYLSRFLIIVVGFRTQASPVTFISDWWSTMPMEACVNIA